MKKSIALVLVAGVLFAAALSGCSNRPSEEEMRRLEALKAEVAALEKQVGDREAEKAALIKANAEKDAKIEQLKKDKALVEQRLKGM
jgi:outer membrane murein-binding lipoprotein Lpp